MSFSGWFARDKIHSTERRFLTEFFDEKSAAKTPKVYKEYRDFIINRYRENPHKRINFTEVRKMLVGDVNSIRRVELGFTLQRNTKRKTSREE